MNMTVICPKTFTVKAFKPQNASAVQRLTSMRAKKWNVKRYVHYLPQKFKL